MCGIIEGQPGFLRDLRDCHTKMAYGKAFVRIAAAKAKNPRTTYTLIGCGVFTLACGCIPFVIAERMKPLNSREEVCRCTMLSCFVFIFC